MYPVTTRDPSRAISCALFDEEAPKTTLWFRSLLWFRLLLGKNQNLRARLLALLFLSSSICKQLGCNGAAKGCGSFGRNRRSERSRPLPARGRRLWFFSLLALVFFSFLSCLVVTKPLFCLLPNWRKGFQKAFLSVGDVYQFWFLYGILKLSTSFSPWFLMLRMGWWIECIHCESVIKFVDRVVVVGFARERLP